MPSSAFDSTGELVLMLQRIFSTLQLEGEDAGGCQSCSGPTVLSVHRPLACSVSVLLLVSGPSPEAHQTALPVALTLQSAAPYDELECPPCNRAMRIGEC